MPAILPQYIYALFIPFVIPKYSLRIQSYSIHILPCSPQISSIFLHFHSINQSINNRLMEKKFQSDKSRHRNYIYIEEGKMLHCFYSAIIIKKLRISTYSYRSPPYYPFRRDNSISTPSLCFPYFFRISSVCPFASYCLFISFHGSRIFTKSPLYSFIYSFSQSVSHSFIPDSYISPLQ